MVEEGVYGMLGEMQEKKRRREQRIDDGRQYYMMCYFLFEDLQNHLGSWEGMASYEKQWRTRRIRGFTIVPRMKSVCKVITETSLQASISVTYSTHLRSRRENKLQHPSSQTVGCAVRRTEVEAEAELRTGRVPLWISRKRSGRRPSGLSWRSPSFLKPTVLSNGSGFCSEIMAVTQTAMD